MNTSAEHSLPLPWGQGWGECLCHVVGGILTSAATLGLPGACVLLCLLSPVVPERHFFLLEKSMTLLARVFKGTGPCSALSTHSTLQQSFY